MLIAMTRTREGDGQALDHRIVARRRPRLTSRLPRPGSAKTASMTTVPPITQLVWTLKHRDGADQRVAQIWRRSTSPSPNPLDRAVSTNSARTHRNQAAAQTANGQRRGAEGDHQSWQEQMP